MIEKKKKAKFEYDFNLESMTDYKCSIIIYVHNKIFKHLFEQAQRKLRYTKIGEMPQDKDIITIPRDYYTTLKIGLRECIDIIKKEVGADKIIIQSTEITSAHYQKEGELWHIHIKIGGLYLDKRG